MLGSGTLGDPYIIQDANDLQNIENDIGAYLQIPIGTDMYEGEDMG